MIARRPLSRAALVAIVAAVVLATAAGAVIGSQVALVGCGGGCATTAAVIGFIGAAFAGAGTTVVSVLAARAFAEWDAIRDSKGARDGQAAGD